ncbi:hypothetical protein IQ270_21895 [Microcoleus sp. LEGE 07076]|uniref:hypothetical protein n=1 Tax=Microcoleus sp. LEGE 07076 TaxID=915322 RepID=UPI00187E026D|nr:hypothetical protein [Microcoleus sp. LEGE 07076]MBE9187230.1 hypothetical protein [Microcoleus sp. LEGE 07076]
MTVSSASIPKISVEAVAQRIFAFRQITPLDRQLLKSAVLNGLDQKDHFHINRLCEGIQNGLILVVE